MAESRRRARPKSQEGFFRRLFPRYENTSVDLTFLVMVILLLVFGLVMMFSASYAQGYYREGNSYHYIVQLPHNVVVAAVGGRGPWGHVCFFPPGLPCVAQAGLAAVPGGHRHAYPVLLHAAGQ